MNKQPHPELSPIHFMLRAQQIAQQEGESDKGYAMLVVSLVTIVMFSLIAATMTFTNLAKSRTDALVDGSSIFYVAEAGLNKRAVEFRSKLDTYSGVAEISAITGRRSLADCLSTDISPTTPGSDYLGCRNYSFKSSNNISRAVEGGNIALSSGKKIDPVTGLPTDEDAVQNKYVAYTLITQTAPQTIAIPSTEDYEGMNALEYRYELRSTAKKPSESEATRAENAAKSGANVDLSMTFTNRVISLFQFAIFYNGDLEFNSTSPMQVQGRVHSNANIYVQPAGEPSPASKSLTTFLSKVSAVGSIYNRVDAWTPGAARTGITRLLLTGTSCPDNSVVSLPSTSNCKDIPDYYSGNTDPLTAAQIDTFQKQLQAGISRLKTPPVGFTRKRRYRTDKVEIGEYFAKADMRLDFVPKRGTSLTVIPFNFTAMKTTGTGVCSIVAPTASNDPAANYVDPKREGLSALKCNQLTKGQLQSLRQPVLVLTNTKQLDTTRRDPRLPTPTDPSPPRGTESTILGRPETLPTAPALTALNDVNNDETKKSKILRALQVALVSTSAPIPVDRLNTAFNNPIYSSPSVDTDLSNNAVESRALSAFKDEFRRRLEIMFPEDASLTPTQVTANREDKLALLSISPNEIAALQGAWFLPAPIQQVITTTAATTTNPLQSGFYDGRERRWISVLQTNIASLAVWNRDGLYVAASDTNMRTAYASIEEDRNNAFNDATTADYSTNGLAFDRATTIPASAKGLQTIGLGSIDSTEGGLIVHASVNDDLNGDDSIDETTEITKDTTKPITETTTVGSVTTTTTIDYYRKYPGVTGSPKSPYAFAFTGGDYLPNNLLLSSDQAIYVQGDFNNNRYIDPTTGNKDNSPDRQSASIVADTITVLSNNCINPTIINPLPAAGVPGGQINCGIGEAEGGANIVNIPMVINAAFLSNTDVSNGNLGTGRGYDASSTLNNRYSGGVNNYIRLLENWNNAGSPISLNYMGSMVSLGTPLEYSGRFRPGGEEATDDVPASYYNIPFRSFSYDTNFSEIGKMPPLTPKASYVQQKNFTRAY
jgi:hypothetical protein